MERNFTDERKSEVHSVLDACLLNWTQLDLQQYSKSSFVYELGLNAVAGFAQSYQSKVIVNLRKMSDTLEDIFDRVNGIEKSYASSHIADATQAVTDLNTYIIRLSEAIHPGQGTMDMLKVNFLNTMWENYSGTLDNAKRKQSLTKLLYEIYGCGTEYNICELYDIIYDENGERINVKRVSAANKNIVIEAFEETHPECKSKLDSLLCTGEPNILAESDKRNIKYIIYTAEEPYRTIYLESVECYEFAQICNNKEERKSFYRVSENKIYIQNADSALYNDNRGAYTTFFHECGHAIDYNYNVSSSNSFCEEFETNNSSLSEVLEATGKEYITLQDAIYYDVYNNIEEQIRRQGVTDDSTVYKILDTFRYENKDKVDELLDYEKEIRQNVIEYYSDSLAGEQNNGTSDVYGGVTNLIIVGQYGHFPEDGDKENYRYWYDAEGNATNAQSRELWAHYFACNMTGDEEAKEAIKQYFPESTKVLEEIAMCIQEENYAH